MVDYTYPNNGYGTLFDIPVDNSKLIQMKPKSRIWLQLGDSRTNLGGANESGSSQPWANPETTTSRMVSKKSAGYQLWAEFWSNFKIEFPQYLNHGVGGDTIVNITKTNKAGRLYVAIQKALAANAAGIVLWGGTNDWTGGAAYLDVIEGYETFITECNKNGLIAWILSDTARGHSSFTSMRFTSTQMKRMERARRWLLEQRNRVGVIITDTTEDSIDTVSTTGDVISAADVTDGLHLAQPLASRIGQRMAKQAELMYDYINYFPTGNADLYDAVENPNGFITANPAMDGTGGSLGGAGGSLATSWTALFNNQTGYTITFSKVTRPDPLTQILEPWQKMALVGTPTVAGTYAGFNQTISLVTYPPGSKIRVIGQLAWDSGLVGIDTIRLGMEGGRVNSPGFFLNYAGLIAQTGKQLDTSRAYEGPFITDVYTIPADATSLSIRFGVYMTQNIPLANANIYGRLIGAILVP